MSEADLETLMKYKREVIKLKEYGKNMNMSDENINEIFEDCFRILQNDINIKKNFKSRPTSRLLSIIKVVFIFIIFSLFLFILLNHHQPTLSLVLRNVQGFIYPGLKMLRLLAMPIIKLFPSLSELYDESCLVENPYFEVEHMECWPCENVHSVINLSGSTNYSLYQSGIPYIIQTLNESVSLKDLQQLYTNNSKIFNEDAQRMKSNNDQFTRAEHILDFKKSNSNTHIIWRMNRMAPARVIRKIFPKPHIISEWSGQSTERFLMIDDLDAEAYTLPNPECGDVLLTQGSGERIIVLKPSKECSHHCRTTSVILKPYYSLWYNWWYWRPISFPTKNSSDISISYLSSYC